MLTLNGEAISEYSSLIPSIYTDSHLRQFLSALAGEPLYTVQDPGESYVLNILHQKDDTHGAHIDTYGYTWLTMIEVPNKEDGGCLELVPGISDKKQLEGPKCVRLCPKPGDCIFLSAHDSVHRVTPLLRSSIRRLVIASAFANEATLNKVSYSSEKLYGSGNSI